MIDLKSQTLEEMTATLKEMGEPAFRGKQVFTWLHKGVTSFDEMSNLSKPLREKLRERCYITAPTVARKQVSKLHRNGGHAVPPRKHRLCFLAGGLPDGLRFLRVYHCWQGERLNTV